MSKKRRRPSASHSANPTIPELEQSKTAVLNTLASSHSRRSYKYAIEKFIAWYCAEPRLGFNRAVRRAVSLLPGELFSVSGYDQPSSLSDSPSGG
jgi:hypothetical protein